MKDLNDLPFSVYWNQMTDEQKAIVKFGMIPLEIEELIAREMPDTDGRQRASGLMDCAQADGGMVC